MKIPLAVLAVLAVTPAYAQQSPSDPTYPAQQMSAAYPGADGLQQAELAPVSDVVVAVEQRLNQIGYPTDTDGRFDANLRNSVMLFQSDNGLRPTGEVDLSTIAALGVNVDPAGQLAAAPATTRMVPAQQTAALVDDNSADYPLLRDEHMSAPMRSLNDPHFENYTGVPQPRSIVQTGNIPGMEPGFPVENLIKK